MTKVKAEDMKKCIIISVIVAGVLSSLMLRFSLCFSHSLSWTSKSISIFIKYSICGMWNLFAAVDRRAADSQKFQRRERMRNLRAQDE